MATRYIDVTMETLEQFYIWNLKGKQMAVLITSAPGMGKSTFSRTRMREIMAEYYGVQYDPDPDKGDVGYYEFKVPGKDEVEVTGPALPYRDPDTGKHEFGWTTSPLVKEIWRRYNAGQKYGVVNLDELMAGTQGVQKVLADLLDRNIHACGGDKLPDGWIVMANGNRAEDKAGSAQLMRHLPNRCLVFNLVFSMPALAAYWDRHDLNPLPLQCAEAYYEHGFFADAVPAHDEPYNTPRQLENLCSAVDVIMAEPGFTKFNLDHETYFSAMIGRQASATFCAFANRIDEIPPVRDVLTSPKTAMLPDHMGYQQIAVHVAMGAMRSEEDANAVLEYIDRCRTDLKVPLAIKLIKVAQEREWYFEGETATRFHRDHLDLLPLAYHQQRR